MSEAVDASAQRVLDLLRELNDAGEHERIEAKTASEVGKSVLETVCAFSNEPGLDGGNLLLGVARGETGDLFDDSSYEVMGVPDPEKVSSDLASQCASAFNRTLRPRIEPVPIGGKTVLRVRVFEASPGEKPVFLTRYGLPRGAFRRIGASDQRCTEDDLQILYDARGRSPYDADVVLDAALQHLDAEAIEEYRQIRREVAPEAEELRSSDEELLQGLNCAREIDGTLRPTVAGLLLFGSALALRRFFGLMRVDYIRVPGREWIPDPEHRYDSVTIRAPLIRAVRRAEAAVLDDLPKAFQLPEGSLQRRDVSPLPREVLREAIVNSVMHRDYRVHGAVQIIRYSNRIEILNPGYSLKSPERLGEPGSEARNPTIAAVFHDTNLAETKGTGVRVMRRLMKEAELVPPTFESSRKDNQFTARLLLHHFLGEDDLAWLEALGEPSLNAEEKLVLVFVREVGAVDNSTFRDLTGVETLRASAGLRHLVDLGLLEKKGQSTATYYVPGERLRASEEAVGTLEPSMAAVKPSMVAGEPDMVEQQPDMVRGKPAMVDLEATTLPIPPRQALYVALPEDLRLLVDGIGRHADEATMRQVIGWLCSWRSFPAEELATLVRRNPDYLKTRYLKPMVRSAELQYTIPDMPKHPNQAYRAPEPAE
ncbi:hypothetical protein BH23GEM4_BH23GEM4_18420 [soil metagenome]